ncbi:hypothetical protein [Sphingomonas sp. GB1N7]|uniref:hypothetical protein n=1 Tax=Parasphingomonas caseinilytica TaxID=3096158 RepID=UPI002FC82580
MMAGVLSGVVAAKSGPPAPFFVVQPSVSPTNGATGQTFTATPGTVANGSITSRTWLLNGSPLSSGLTATPSSGGSLTYQEFAGIVASNLITATVAAIPALPANIAWRANAFSTSAADGAAIPVPVVTGGTNLAGTYGSAKFVANAVNGLPGIRADGNALHAIPRSGNAAYYAGQDAQNWTMHILFTNTPTQDPLNVFLQINDAKDALVKLGRSAGREDTIGARVGSVATISAHSVDAGPHVLTIRSTTASVTSGIGQTSAGNTLVALDGLPIGMYVGTMPKPGDGSGGGVSYLFGQNGGYALYATTTTVVDMLVYNEVHTLGQIWDAAKALRYSAGVGMASKILMVPGSSLKQGSGADSLAFSVVPEILRQCNLPFGSVGAFALGGIDFGGMNQMGPELDGLLARVGAANCYLLAGEGYNALLGSVTAAQAAASFVAYLTARKDAGWLPANMFLDTITGVSTARQGYEKYPDYVTAVKAIPANNPALAAARVINTAGVYSDNASEIRVGFDGSNNPYNIHLVDGVHMSGKINYATTDSGYPYQVDKVFKAPIGALALGG